MVAFVFPTIYSLPLFFSSFILLDLLLRDERDRLFLSFSEGTRILRACESPEGTRPCRERKRRCIYLVSLPSTPTTLYFYPFCSLTTRPSDRSRAQSVSRKRCTTTCASASLFPPLASFNRDKLLARPSTLSPKGICLICTRVHVYR